MALEIVNRMNREAAKQKAVASFKIGDSVRVHVRIQEGGKERIQVFSGTVLGRRGFGASEMFTVRRISHGVGVERVFPIHSPFIDKIEVEGSARVCRAKLYFLRRSASKRNRLKDAGRAAKEPSAAAPADAKPAGA
jgi:large subunit ribosomal protein L19